MFFILIGCIIFYHLEVTIICQTVYIGIKPIESKCMLLNDENCYADTIIFKFKHRTNLFNIAEFTRSQETINLKMLSGFNSIVESDTQNCNIIQLEGENQIPLTTFEELENNYQIDDILHIFEKNFKSRTSIRLRINHKTTYNFGFISYSIISNIISLNEYYRSIIITSARVLWSYILEPPPDYLYWNEKYFFTFKKISRFRPQSLITEFQLKNSDNNLFTGDEEIFKKYYLDITSTILNQNFKIRYKHHQSDIPESEEYSDKDQICNFDCKNRGTCNFENSNGIFNPKCTCREPFYGNDCNHIYYCNNCEANKCIGHNLCLTCNKGWTGQNCELIDCETLNMCGPYGKCASNTTAGRKCNCLNGAHGIYCGNYTVHIVKTNLNDSKVNITRTDKSGSVKPIVIAISLIIIGLIIIAIIIIYIKNKK